MSIFDDVKYLIGGCYCDDGCVVVWLWYMVIDERDDCWYDMCDFCYEG